MVGPPKAGTLRTFLTALLALVIIASLLALDNYLFQRWLGLSHWQWYLANGSLISAGLAIFSVAWGDLNKNAGLISARPLDYIGAQLQLVGLPLVSFGAQFRSAPGDRYRASLLDTLLSIPLVLLLIVFCFVYLLVIVPPQYFVFLLCGAPARIIAKSSSGVAARMQGSQVTVEETPAGQAAPEDWWNAGMNQKPVTITTLFSVLFFITLKIFVP
jgi:hypothetical protein